MLLSRDNSYKKSEVVEDNEVDYNEYITSKTGLGDPFLDHLDPDEE